MTKILVTYHSGEGQTTRIAERISTVLRELGVEVDVRDAADAPLRDWARHSASECGRH